VERRVAPTDHHPMNVQAQAALEMQSKILFDARAQVMQVQSAPPAADAPAAVHADVILTLSAAAQSLRSV